MTILDDLRATGFGLNSRTLLIGLAGPGKFPSVVTLEEVRVFAAEQLSASGAAPDEIVAIAIASDDESAEVIAMLRKLADREELDPARELRKWQIVLLKRVMSELPQDPLYGLLALTEFWERFDFPSDSPHVVQGRGNQISPADYFSELNYQRLAQKHRAWISEESAALIRSQPDQR